MRLLNMPGDSSKPLFVLTRPRTTVRSSGTVASGANPPDLSSSNSSRNRSNRVLRGVYLNVSAAESHELGNLTLKDLDQIGKISVNRCVGLF